MCRKIFCRLIDIKYFGEMLSFILTDILFDFEPIKSKLGYVANKVQGKKNETRSKLAVNKKSPIFVQSS